jgi:hypothetical protein
MRLAALLSSIMAYLPRETLPTAESPMSLAGLYRLWENLPTVKLLAREVQLVMLMGKYTDVSMLFGVPMRLAALLSSIARETLPTAESPMSLAGSYRLWGNLPIVALLM